MTLTSTAPRRRLPPGGPGVPRTCVLRAAARVMQAFPPADRDLRHQTASHRSACSTWSRRTPCPAPALHEALERGARRRAGGLAAALRGAGDAQQNGWRLTYHVFDYNLDFFEVGALDDDRWKLPDDPAATCTAPRPRAAACGATTATRPRTRWSTSTAPASPSTARSLRGALREPPPCEAFWSLTMYDAQEFFLVPNPIDRYSIGDRTRGLHAAGDGSLTSCCSTTSRTRRRGGNWLPTPPGRSARSCACTSPGPRSSTAATSCRRSCARLRDRREPGARATGGSGRRGPLGLGGAAAQRRGAERERRDGRAPARPRCPAQLRPSTRTRSRRGAGRRRRRSSGARRRRRPRRRTSGPAGRTARTGAICGSRNAGMNWTAWNSLAAKR